jgi:hypothetical protein
LVSIGDFGVIAQAEEQDDRRHQPDRRRDPEHGAQLDAQRKQRAGQHAAKSRAEVIHRAVEAERTAALRR